MKRILSFSVPLLLIAAYFLWPGFQTEVNEAYQIFTSNDRAAVTEYVRQFGIWGPVVFILVMIVQMFLIVVPSWLLMIIAVLAYGKVWGVVLSVVAVFVASSVGWVIGEVLGEATITRMVGEKTEKKLENVLEKYGPGAVVIFRLAPFLSNDAISFIAGMLKMKYTRFIAATLVGIVPLTVLIALFSDNTEMLKSGLVWVGGVSLLLYGGYVIWDVWGREEKGE